MKMKEKEIGDGGDRNNGPPQTSHPPLRRHLQSAACRAMGGARCRKSSADGNVTVDCSHTSHQEMKRVVACEGIEKNVENRR